MLTHVYVAKLKPGTPDGKVVAWMDAIRGLRVDGMLELACGPDLGLRDGNWDIAITADFPDVAAWRRYDQDELHNQIRAEHAKPIVEAQQRSQFQRSRHFEVLGDVRNVTLLNFKPDLPAGHADLVASRLRQLRCEGMHHLDAGPDLGLADGTASLAVVCDFESPELYWNYDRDERHNEIRETDIAPYLDSSRRVQFELRMPAAP